MHPTLRFLPALLATGLLTAGPAQAAITVIAHYQMGEGGSLANGGPIDSSGNGHDIANAVNGAAGLGISTTNPSPVSGTYAEFDGSSQGFYVENFAPDNNFGIDAWVRLGRFDQDFRNIFSTGGNTGGLQLSYATAATGFAGSLAGSAWVGDTYLPASTDEWVHLAVVRDGGVTRFYVNGVQQGAESTASIQSASHIHLGVNSGASAYFDGAVDEARIFTFAPGQFAISDLAVPVPEPSALLLAGAGLTGVLGRRRRA